MSNDYQEFNAANSEQATRGTVLPSDEIDNLDNSRQDFNGAPPNLPSQPPIGQSQGGSQYNPAPQNYPQGYQQPPMGQNYGQGYSNQVNNPPTTDSSGSSGLAIASLVIGIAGGILMLTQYRILSVVLGIVGLILSINSRRKKPNIVATIGLIVNMLLISVFAVGIIAIIVLLAIELR